MGLREDLDGGAAVGAAVGAAAVMNRKAELGFEQDSEHSPLK
jgi:hypothetical protein